MITTHDGRQVAICDGCDAILIIPPKSGSPLVLHRRRWATNETGVGRWQHFCASCDLEFGDGRVVPNPDGREDRHA